MHSGTLTMFYTTLYFNNHIVLIVLLFTEYLDPYLHNGNFSRKIILGFRSVLKLTSSYPRNPQYKLATPKICSFCEIISFQNINNRNLDVYIQYVHKELNVVFQIFDCTTFVDAMCFRM
jgi:hypothetical protein